MNLGKNKIWKTGKRLGLIARASFLWIAALGLALPAHGEEDLYSAAIGAPPNEKYRKIINDALSGAPPTLHFENARQPASRGAQARKKKHRHRHRRRRHSHTHARHDSKARTKKTAKASSSNPKKTRRLAGSKSSSGRASPRVLSRSEFRESGAARRAIAGGNEIGAVNWSGPSTGCSASSSGSLVSGTGDLQDLLSTVGCSLTREDGEETGLESARKQHAQLFPRSDTTTRTIQGVNVQGSSDELAAAERILSANPPSAWRSAAASCGGDLQCAMGKAFGNEEAALRALAIQKRFGYTVSLNQRYAKGGRENIWSLTQVRTMEDFFKKLPAEVTNTTQLRDIILFPNEAREDVRAQYRVHVTPAGIMDPETRTMLINTPEKDTSTGLLWELAHEFGHAYDFSRPIQFKDKSGFNALSGWTANGHSPNARFINSYSATNPEEDFANAFRDYLNSPRSLANVDKDKFNWMKANIFGGKEYSPPGLIQSAELESQISAAGGYPALILTCLGNLDAKVSPEHRLYVGDPADRQLTRADGFLDEQATRCFAREAAEIAKRMPTDQQVCQVGGSAGIEAHLNAKLKYPLEQALKTADAQARALGLRHQACVPREFVSSLGLALSGKIAIGEVQTNPELEKAVATRIASRLAKSCRD